MPTQASLNGGARRTRRSALGQLLSMWAALPGSARRFASDFAAVFVQEGRQVPVRLAWSAAAVAAAAILVIAGWLLLCAGTASWLVNVLAWRWEMALYLIALCNLVLAGIVLIVAYRWATSPFFPVTSYELHRLRSEGGASEEGKPNLPSLQDAGPKERALMRSEAELQARITQVKRVTPRLLATPSVIAATAGVGFVAGLLTSRSKQGRRNIAASAQDAPVSRRLLHVAVAQLSSLAFAAALREIQRRTGFDRPIP